MIYARLLRPLLFRLEPEAAHQLTLQLLALTSATALGSSALRRNFHYHDPALRVSVFGIEFQNPVGLAAGYDKDGVAIAGLGMLGFGHVEIGTLTPEAQTGNPRPRIFRLVTDEAMINRLGFPNRGIDALAKQSLNQARRFYPETCIGLNLGKAKDTPNARAVEDYIALLQVAYPKADYIAINVSSPNTPGLRELQSEQFLPQLLASISAKRAELAQQSNRLVPLLVKISPDMGTSQLEGVVQAAMEAGIDGLIATNTTVRRVGLLSAQQAETGGLSGAPLRERATEVVRQVYRLSAGRLPIVGVGGIDNAAAALERIRAGASLVQIYTGMVYHGPSLVQRIKRGLVAAVHAAGVASIQELVGSD